MLVAVVVGALVVLAGIAAAVEYRRGRRAADAQLRRLLVRRVVVTLKGGETFAGLLAAADSRSLVLAEAEALVRSTRTPVDGALLLPRAEVAYLQHV